MTPLTHIHPIPLGLFRVPGVSISDDPGVTIEAPYVVCAYLVRSREVTVLFDTGIVGDHEAVERYAPHFFDLDDQLGAVGVSRQDIDVVVNCHLHADHAGGNHLFPRVPIVVQRKEVDAAEAVDYTVREACVDFPGAELVVIEGRHRLAAGVDILPTPGHSPGHQSLLVGDTEHGTVLLAGQAFGSASDYAAAALAHQLGGDRFDVSAPDWMSDLQSSQIDLALFAHDLAQWRPQHPPFTGATPREAW